MGNACLRADRFGSHTVEAIHRAVAIMRRTQDESVELAAIKFLVEHAWGKPKQTVDVPDQGRTLEQILRR